MTDTIDEFGSMQAEDEHVGLKISFPTSYSEILQRIETTDPLRYGKTRNYVNGSVSYLSPYISRGVISTRLVLEKTLQRGFHPQKVEKWISELAWRDYFQRTWQAKGQLILEDVKHPQSDVQNHEMSEAVFLANTGIEAIDKGIRKLYQYGYMHNHMRMYVAAICCNMAKSHWSLPAKWLYYHLLDADVASNHLSWQWVAGSFSHKKYYCNQENINKYTFSNQRNTFLDETYEKLPQREIPQVLMQTISPQFVTPLPGPSVPMFEENLPLILYNTYNLDPLWRNELAANRVLLLEPSHFKQFPVSAKTIEFVLALAQNIKGLQVFVGELDDLIMTLEANGKLTSQTPIFFKEHPTTLHYGSNGDPREWMVPEVEGYFSGFFSYWKKIEKQIMKLAL